MKEKYAEWLALTDTHATDGNLVDQEDTWRQAVEECKKRNIKKIAHLGDWVTERKSQSLAVMKHIKWIRDLLKKNNISLIGLSGNHDKTDQEDIFSYATINEAENFKIIDNYYTEIGKIVNISYISYFPELGSFQSKLQDLKDSLDETKVNILLFHEGVNGGLSHKNATSNKEVAAGIFEGFDVALSGHYHNRNKVEYDKVDIQYIGSPRPTNFGEDNNKGFTIIYSDGSYEFTIAKFSKYETVEVDFSDIDGKFMSTLKKKIASENPNIRLEISGDKSDLLTVKKKKFAEIGVEKLILENNEVSIKGESKKVEFVNLDKDTIISEYEEFCKKIEISPDLGLSYM